MPASSTSLTLLLEGRGPCPVCDEFDCNHQFYGDAFWRIGDPMDQHPKMQGRTIPSPRRIIEGGRVVFGEGDLMTAEEAARYGVTGPTEPEPGKRKGESTEAYEARMKRLREDRMKRPSEDRSA